jgi:Na+/H+ antiporter NhaC
MIGAIFIGFPISFTMLFFTFVFGYFGLGRVVFDLAYFQTIGLMKEEVFAAVPLFIFMGFITEQAGLMERLFRAFRNVLAPLRGSLYAVVILTSAVFAMATGIVGAAVTVLGIMAGPMNDQIRLRRRRATSRLSPRERLSLIESAGPAGQQMTALPQNFGFIASLASRHCEAMRFVICSERFCCPPSEAQAFRQQAQPLGQMQA